MNPKASITLWRFAPQSRSRYSVLALFASPALLGFFAALNGCTNDLSDIDARTDALVRQRAGALGGGLPSSRNAPPDRTVRPSSLLKEPPSTNPAASDLRYTPADEARSVADRLENYQRPKGDAVNLDLPGVLRQAQVTGREFLDAEEEYVLAAIRLLISRHSFDWRFFANTTVSATASGTDGAFTSPLNVMQDLGVTKRFENGGQLEARLVWNAVEQLREVATDRYVQSSALVLSGSVPLLRGAGTVASEDLIQSERELVYAARTFEAFRRSYLVDISRDYFDLAQQQAVIANQERQLKSLQQLEERTAALVTAGRTAEFERNIAQNRVLGATSSLANQREAYILALDRFKIRLGLSIDQHLNLAPIALDIVEPEITPDAAAALALDYRLDLQTRRDRVDDARRAVQNARNGVLPDATLSGSVTARTKSAAREGGLVYETDDAVYQGGITFGLPLDRENERLALRAANIALEKNTRDLDQFRDGIVVEVRSRVREIDRARFNLTLAEQAVEINTRRMEEQDLKRDTVDAQTIVDTQNDLLSSANARDQAVTDLRNAILGYLLSTAQLRVNRDGTLEPLPGMNRQTP